MSARIGVLPSTWMIATTRRGSSGSRLISVTSPTRRPLNDAIEPFDRPETEPEKTTRTAWRVWPAVAAGEPVDEAEGSRDHRQGEQSDQGVIGTRFHR